jgi:WD40 repeat protein
VSASADKSIRIWDVKVGKSIRTEKTREENLNLSFTSDGNTLCVSNVKEELNFYDWRMWKLLKSFKVADKTEKI